MSSTLLMPVRLMTSTVACDEDGVDEESESADSFAMIIIKSTSLRNLDAFYIPVASESRSGRYLQAVLEIYGENEEYRSTLRDHIRTPCIRVRYCHGWQPWTLYLYPPYSWPCYPYPCYTLCSEQHRV